MAMNMRAMILAGLLGSTIFAGAALAADTSNVPLVTAAKQGDREAVRSLLNGIPQKVIAGPEGTAALVWAVSRNDLETTDLLLRAGADVKAANEFGATALYAAAAHRDPAMTVKLLAAGADANAPLMSGETPLIEAARRGSLDTVNTLLSAKANPNAKEANYGHTALMAAVSQRHSAVVEELLRRGAEVDLGAKSGFTPLMFAAQQGDANIARILINAGANPNFAQPQFGVTPLLIASAMVKTDVVALLLDKGADPNAANSRGYNPLLWVVRDSDYGIDEKGKDDIVKIVRLLLAHGANPNFQLKQPGSPSRTVTEISLQGATPLVFAAEVNHLEVVKALLAAGADPSIATEQGTTALMLSAGAGTDIQRMRSPEERATAVETAKLLVEHGVDVNAVGQYGWTALHSATYQGLSDVIEFLVSKGAKINEMDAFGQTPLSISLAVLVQDIGARRLQIPRRYRKDVAELILKLGATPLDKSGVVVVLQRTGEEIGREATQE
jgi:ankyrin repeat protein